MENKGSCVRLGRYQRLLRSSCFDVGNYQSDCSERPARVTVAMEAFTRIFFKNLFPGFLVSFLSRGCCWENTSHTDHCDLWTNIKTFGPQATLACFKTATCTKGTIYSEQKSHSRSVNTLT